MPPVASLPAILVKSCALVGAIALISRRMPFSIWSVALALRYWSTWDRNEIFLIG